MESLSLSSIDDWVDKLGWSGLAANNHHSQQIPGIEAFAREAKRLPCLDCAERVGCVVECKRFRRYVKKA